MQRFIVKIWHADIGFDHFTVTATDIDQAARTAIFISGVAVKSITKISITDARYDH